MTDYLLGVDIGTYESKGVLVTTEGEVVASAAAGHALSMPRPGWFEHDAEAVWWHDFVTLSRRLLQTSGLPAARDPGDRLQRDRALRAAGRPGWPAPAPGHPLRHRHAGGR